jgi:hypothetical protein
VSRDAEWKCQVRRRTNQDEHTLSSTHRYANSLASDRAHIVPYVPRKTPSIVGSWGRSIVQTCFETSRTTSMIIRTAKTAGDRRAKQAPCAEHGFTSVGTAAVTLALSAPCALLSTPCGRCIVCIRNNDDKEREVGARFRASVWYNGECNVVPCTAFPNVYHSEREKCPLKCKRKRVKRR